MLRQYLPPRILLPADLPGAGSPRDYLQHRRAGELRFRVVVGRPPDRLGSRLRLLFARLSGARGGCCFGFGWGSAACRSSPIPRPNGTTPSTLGSCSAPGPSWCSIWPDRLVTTHLSKPPGRSASRRRAPMPAAARPVSTPRSSVTFRRCSRAPVDAAPHSYVCGPGGLGRGGHCGVGRPAVHRTDLTLASARRCYQMTVRHAPPATEKIFFLAQSAVIGDAAGRRARATLAGAVTARISLNRRGNAAFGSLRLRAGAG